MPTLALTDRHIKTLKPTGQRVDHFDRRVTGLAVRLAASGRKTWCVFFRVNRRVRRALAELRRAGQGREGYGRLSRS